MKKNEMKEKIKEWLKNPFNKIFILIIIFAFFLRLHYFLLTKNQPLWWDEAEYMAAAKGYAGLVDFKLGSIRLPGFPLVASLFFRLGIKNEVFLRFFLNFIPSLIVLLLIYLCIEEMYEDKRIALISLLIASVLWEHLFYSNRFHTENWGLIFELFAILIFFKYFIKKDLPFKKQIIVLFFVLFFGFMSVFFRPGNIIFLPSILLFLPLLYSNKCRTNKKFFILIILFYLLFFFFIYFLIINVNKFPLIANYYHPENKIAWNVLAVFYGFYETVIPNIPSIFFYVFLLGVLLFFYEIYVYFPRIIKFEKNKEDINLKSDIFNFILLITVLFSFIFFIRPFEGYEYRWFFPLLIAMLVFTTKGIIFFSEIFKNFTKNKKITTFILILIVVIGCWNQIVHADKIIKIKLDSYAPVRDAALWIKEHSSKYDVIFSISQPQTAYYSERKVISYSEIKNETEMEEFILKYKPKYIEVSIFEIHPKWINSWLNNNQNKISPIKVYTILTNQGEQPVLIIYELRYF